MSTKMYTRRGDQGETGLLYGGRVSKTDPRCEAYGDLDEGVSAMGLARSLSTREDVKQILLSLQKDAFIVGGELATDILQYDKFRKHFNPITSEMVEDLEKTTDEISSKVELPQNFIMPGGSPGAAAIDLARSIVRRVERRAVALKNEGLIGNDETLRYLNRLSSLLYVLARYEEKPVADQL